MPGGPGAAGAGFVIPMSSSRKKLWLSYSWKDNVDKDVDFIAKEIEKRGISVKLDRYVLIAGQRLWPQIESHIQNPAETDAWALFMTQNSLASEPVREEIAYALDRALKSRGGTFPLIGINPGDVDSASVPALISIRLYVSLTDDDWLDRIVSGVHGVVPTLATSEIIPIVVKEYPQGSQTVIEARPRAGRWHPGAILVPEADWGKVKGVMQGPSGTPPSGGMIAFGEIEYTGKSGDKWKGYSVGHNITPINSMYLTLEGKVEHVLVGQANGTIYIYRCHS
jgi:hypothetical protein